MKRALPADDGLVYLGIECGATRTVAFAHAAHSLRMEFGGANLRLLNDAQLERHFRAIAKVMPRPTAMCIGMAGARTETDRLRIRRVAGMAWRGVPCYATNDLETALMAAESLSGYQAFRHLWKRRSGGGLTMDGREANQIASIPRVLVLSGTGSCCFGRTWDGKTAKVGGWGHILGDKGSGFEIGLRALKAVVYYFDRDGEWSRLGRRILRALQLNEPDDLIGWVQRAAKDEIAALAVEVFQARARRDRIAADILAGAAESLAKDAAACARRLAGTGSEVQFVLAGSVLLKQPRFAETVACELKQRWPKAIVTPLKQESVHGAVQLATEHFPPSSPVEALDICEIQRLKGSDDTAASRSVRSLSLSPTEQRHPQSLHLDRMPLGGAIALMLRDDEKIPLALLTERKKIEAGVRLIVRSFRKGGRLFYVGAGSSGRLGVLDASECPPTFRTDPEMVQGIIAGGQRALWEAVEGAEDDGEAGGRAMQFRHLSRRDTVVGMAASGRTPFVWGALQG